MDMHALYSCHTILVLKLVDTVLKVCMWNLEDMVNPHFARNSTYSPSVSYIEIFYKLLAKGVYFTILLLSEEASTFHVIYIRRSIHRLYVETNKKILDEI